MDIRLANIYDAKDIERDIYAPYVKDTLITFEYDVPSIEEMKQRISHTLKRIPYLVATIDKKIVAYAYASSFKGRKAYDWACELSIYVDKDYKGQGIGKQLYLSLFDYLRNMNIVSVYACITYPNNASESFHKSLGFHKAAHFHKCGYKFNKWIDVVWYEKSINDFDNVKDVEWFTLNV